MKFLNVRELRTSTAKVWEDLEHDREMVVTNNGRPVAILISAAESDVEDSLRAIRQARAMQAVASIQRKSVERGTEQLTLDEIDGEIRNVRKKRAR